jgi:creatinine amidohydrolase
VGIDTYAVQHRTRLACEKANVVMFPAVPFAENAEAMNNPGAVAMRREVLFDLVWNILDEIGRNGFRKIVIVSGHGGNVNFVGYLLQDSLYRDRDYLLYRCNVRPSAELQEKLLETEEQAHAGEQETSMALAAVPNLVKMKNVPNKAFPFRGRLGHLKETTAAVWWCADVPAHYCGDARPATARKGGAFIDDIVDRMASCFISIRDDEEAWKIYREYRGRKRRGGVK